MGMTCNLNSSAMMAIVGHIFMPMCRCLVSCQIRFCRLQQSGGNENKLKMRDTSLRVDVGTEPKVHTRIRRVLG